MGVDEKTCRGAADAVPAPRATVHKAWKNVSYAGGVNRLAVIHFPEGAVAFSREGEYCQAASCRIDPADIAGTNGAGDAFAAGVIYALHEGMPLERVLRVGNASGYFNLLSATANKGAVDMEKINRKLEQEIIATGSAKTTCRN